MTTVADLIERTRSDLLGPFTEARDQLDGAITTTASTLVSTWELSNTGISAGSVLEVDDELMYVWDTNADSKTHTIARGYFGTTPTSHSSAAIITVAPRFPRVHIRAALAEDILAWPRTLYSVATVDLDALSDTTSFDLDGIPSSFLRLLEILRSPDTTTSPDLTDWIEIQGGRIERNVPTASYPSGTALFIPQPLGYTGTLRVVYAKRFDVDPFTDAIDLETDVGLAPSMFDIPRYGALWRLLGPREIRRTDKTTQNQSADNEAVPPGYITQTMSRIRELHRARLREEAERLTADYGWEHA